MGKIIRLAVAIKSFRYALLGFEIIMIHVKYNKMSDFWLTCVSNTYIVVNLQTDVLGHCTYKQVSSIFEAYTPKCTEDSYLCIDILIIYYISAF